MIKFCTSNKSNRCGKTHNNYVTLYFLLAFIGATIYSTTVPVLASGGNLTDLFYTAAFSGSWEVFNKFNWLGKFMQCLISAFCLIGLVLICCEIVISLLYLSNKNLFDKIHELKSAGKGQKFFGFAAMGREVFNANYGVGLDAIVGFFLSLLPDVKSYSYFSDENRAYNLTDEETVTTFILKISLPTIMMIFFFSIGFSGTLWRAYGNVVDAMATAAETAVDVNLSKYVDRLMNSGSSYQFSFSADGTHFGKFRQSVAKEIYSKVLRLAEDVSTESKLAIGKAIENKVNQDLTASMVDNLCGSHVTEKDYDAKNLVKTITVNATASYPDIKAMKSYKLSDFTGTSDNGMYLHVTIQKKSNSDETNYFDINKKGNNNSNKPSNQIKN